jgi:hypothetical protein
VYPAAQFTSIPVTTAGPVRYTFLDRNDADYVVRGGQADLGGAFEVFITVRDEDEKPYSNDAVHLDVLFGSSNMGPAFDVGGAAVAPIGGGPNSQGLFFPELYVPKNHVLYFDVSRDDAFAAGAAVATVSIPFTGQKVFEK